MGQLFHLGMDRRYQKRLFVQTKAPEGIWEGTKGLFGI